MTRIAACVVVAMLCVTALPPPVHAVDWDPKLYAKHSPSQLSTALLLLEKMKLRGDEAILDIGCGDGGITSTIAERVPAGRVVGVDVSRTMIDHARQTYPTTKYPNLRFQIGDAAHLKFTAQFDLAVSFSALHWVRDQGAVLRGIREALKPGGLFAMTMVRGFYAPFEDTTDELIRSDRWGKYLTQYSAGFQFVQRDRYLDLLKAHGFKPLQVRDISLYLLFESRDSFKTYVAQWYAYKDAIPEDQRDEFLNDVIDRYLVKQPVDAAGQILFIVRHLNVAAIKDAGDGK